MQNAVLEVRVQSIHTLWGDVANVFFYVLYETVEGSSLS
jgi:hypothetical protein